MEESKVRLELLWDWWTWRGYPRLGDPALESIEDREFPECFDHHSFPSLKPDFDVFGPPKRSRRQRGWYQIKRWPPVPDAGLDIPDHHTKLATGSDIPPEMFELVHEALLGEFAAAGFSKRELGACASVCRYWARCQRIIFHKVTLTSREDIYDLIELLRSPTSAFSEFLNEVHIPVQSFPKEPWIHLLSTLYPYLPNAFPSEISVEGPILSGRRSLRSIHQGLPRVPPVFSSTIEELHLSNLHFDKLEDLLHTVWELRSLENLHCVRVTWGSLESNPPTRKASANRKETSDRFVHMSQCGPCPAQAALWLLTRLCHREDASFSRQPLPMILALTQAVEPGMTSATSNVLNVHVKDDCQLRFWWQDVEDSASDSHPDPEIRLLADQVRHTAPTRKDLWRIHTVVMEIPKLVERDTKLDWMKVDWTAVRDVLSAYAVEKLVCGFRFDGDMQAFVTQVANGTLATLSRNSGLRYAIWISSGGKYRRGSWFRTSGDGEIQEDSCTTYLFEVYG